MSHLFMHKFLEEGKSSTQDSNHGNCLYKVVYSVKTVKLVFNYDQDKTFSPREYVTPRIIAYPVIFCHQNHTG